MISVIDNLNLLVVSLPESEQEEEIYCLIQSHQTKSSRICYLLLRTAYFYMHDELKKRNLLSNLHIVDLLGKDSNPAAHNIMLTSLNSANISEIISALDYKIKKDNCNLIIIDTINQLLHYHPRQEIQKLTNWLKTSDTYKDIKKIFLFSAKDDLVQEENTMLFNDLELFADKMIISNNR